jgi:hypothetical protein
VYVAATERPDARMRVSTDGGDVPAWTKTGRELLYVAPGSSAGERFITSRFEPPPPDRPARHIEVVLNGFDELRSSSPRR